MSSVVPYNTIQYNTIQYNTGIIHAGFDDKPGSLRAKYCWPGNQMFPQLDRELHFGFQRNGSLVVAKNDAEVGEGSIAV